MSEEGAGSVVGFGHALVGLPEAGLHRVVEAVHGLVDPRGRRLHRVGSTVHARVVKAGPELHRVRSPRPGVGGGARWSVRSVAELLILREVGRSRGCEVDLVAGWSGWWTLSLMVWVGRWIGGCGRWLWSLVGDSVDVDEWMTGSIYSLAFDPRQDRGAPVSLGPLSGLGAYGQQTALSAAGA